MKPLALLAAPLALAATFAAAAPPGAEACDGADRSEAAWAACVEAVAGPCEARREAEGSEAWAGCLSERAEAWERALVARAGRLGAMGHDAGEPAALAAFLAARTERCRDPQRIEALMAAHGKAATDGAVLRCELLNSLHRAVLLEKMAREARAARQ